MTTLQERIGGERRRLKAVRTKLSAAVAQGASGEADWAPFYVAVGDYMEASIRRLLDQDVKMGDMIRDKVEVVDNEIADALSRMHDRLADLEQRLDRVLAARDKLRADDSADLSEFESAARELTDYIVANMGHQEGGANSIAGKLFGPADWERMAGITDEDMAREIALFDAVTATTPLDLELPAD